MLKGKRILLLFLLVISPVLFSYTPGNHQVIYTSNTKVEYNTGTKSLEFSTKLFTKNAETALGVKIDNAKFDRYMNNYLKKHIQVTVNGIPRSIRYAGKQVTLKASRIYYEVLDVDGNIRSIEIRNTLLVEKFPNQQNFVNINVKGKKSSFICKKGSTKGKVIF